MLGWLCFMSFKVSPSLLATIGSLVGAGAVGVPVSMLLLSFLLLLPTDATIMAKTIGPVIGALATFLFGFWYYIPISVFLGGSAHVFLTKVGFRTRLSYLLAGPIVGLSVAMITHFLAPSIVNELLSGGWPTQAYIGAWCLGGIVTMAVFWAIRRPDRVWDDLADRRRAGEDV
jgi:hypothetical protein